MMIRQRNKSMWSLALVAMVLLMLTMTSAAQADAILRVDFNSNQDGGGDSTTDADPSLSTANTNQEGWSSYHANHEAAAEFVTADYDGITITPAWPNTSDNRVQQSIDRGTGNDNNWDDADGWLNLITDFIGIDARTGNGGNGNWDGSTGTPTYMTLALGGLPAGVYGWTSFHHDTENVHGPFAVWVSTDGGDTFEQVDDGIMTDNTDGGNPESDARESGPDIYALSSTYQMTFAANGSDDVVLRFAPYAAVAVHRQIWGMNAFELEQLVTDSAGLPSPKSGATDVLRDSILTWVPGTSAVTHDLYLGTSFEDVNAATVPTAPGLDVNSLDPGRLDLDQTYYWRVDEVASNGEVFTGSVWSFTIEPTSIQIPGTDIVVTASSNSGETSLPEKTNDGSGLDEDGAHSIATETMWFTAMGDTDPWIQFEFADVKQVDVMKIWNSNSSAEGFLGYGVKGVEIAYSQDGETWAVFEDVNEFSQASGTPAYTQYDEIALGGIAAKMVRLNIQSNFGGFLESYSLSEVQFKAIPAAARTPMPESDSVDMTPDTELSWRSGRNVAESLISISTDPNALDDGSAMTATSNTNSINLSAFDIELGETYYWRVDEVNNADAVSVWPGPVWNLSTVEAIVVDDFESYANDSPDRPFQVWLDGYGYSADEFFPAGYNGNGTGAGIGHDIWSVASDHYNGSIMETTNVKSGGQSMPFYYSNSGSVASQTERTFATAQDWTIAGVKTLSIAFSGQEGNTGTLYVKINNTKVTYPHAAANIAMGAWQAWNIDLTSMNVQNVTTLQIGVDGAGASGMILIDDIKLYPTAGELIVPAEPDAAGLVGHWKFDENSGTTAADSSGNNNYGTVNGGAQWGAGKVGGALTFDGVDDMVVVNQSAGLPIYNNGTDNAYSISMWVKGAPQNDMRVFSEGSTTTNTPLLNLGTQNSGQFATYIRPEEGTVSNHPLSQAHPFDDTWHHLVWVDNNGTATLYVDGLADGGDFSYTRGTMALDTTSIGGILRAAPSHFFTGQIDEVRVYNQALSAGEALWLAGVTSAVDKPF